MNLINRGALIVVGLDCIDIRSCAVQVRARVGHFNLYLLLDLRLRPLQLVQYIAYTHTIRSTSLLATLNHAKTKTPPERERPAIVRPLCQLQLACVALHCAGAAARAGTQLRYSLVWAASHAERRRCTDVDQAQTSAAQVHTRASPPSTSNHQHHPRRYIQPIASHIKRRSSVKAWRTLTQNETPVNDKYSESGDTA